MSAHLQSVLQASPQQAPTPSHASLPPDLSFPPLCSHPASQTRSGRAGVAVVFWAIFLHPSCTALRFTLLCVNAVQPSNLTK